MDFQSLNEFMATRVGDGVLRLVRITLILLAAWFVSALLSRVIRKVRDRIKNNLGTPEQVNRAETLGRVIRYAATVVVTLVAGVLVLSEMGISVAPILGAAGVVGIALGFGAQNLVRDYFTGFFLLLEGQLSTGDVVTIADMSGTVEDITLRHVRLRDAQGHVHYVSNGLITTVTNRTQGFAYAVMDVGVSWRQPLDKVIETMQAVGADLATDPRFTAGILEPFEIIGVETLGESSVVLRGRFKVRASDQWSVRREYLKRVKTAFDERGIQAPFPQLTVHAGVVGQEAALLRPGGQD
jgi:small conductance mechanosensitive channel